LPKVTEEMLQCVINHAKAIFPSVYVHLQSLSLEIQERKSSDHKDEDFFEMNAIGRIPFLAAMFFIPGLSFVVVAGSIYMQGLASPFLGIFLGIAGLFFGLKAIVFSVSVIDEVVFFAHRRWPEDVIGTIKTSILGRIKKLMGENVVCVPSRA
jgi:hypothetical protein